LRSKSVKLTLNNMAKASKPTAISDPARKQAVIYARVSSKERLQDRIQAMYVDKLDGLVDAAFVDKMLTVARGAESIDRYPNPINPTWTRACRFSN
jgi:predicted site-specific integrase-resolvase